VGLKIIIRSFIIYVFSANNLLLKFKEMRWAEHATSTGNMRNEYKVLVGKLKGMRPF
jgi:hypothetical protein